MKNKPHEESSDMQALKMAHRLGLSDVDALVMPLPEIEVLSLDELTQICGMFDGQSDLNNGYGCKAPQNTEAPGCCYSFSCPIAWELDEEDDEWNETLSPGDWMKQHSEFKEA